MKSACKTTISIMLILCIFSNYFIFSETSVLEAKDIIQFENILRQQLELKNSKFSVKYEGRMNDVQNIIKKIVEDDVYIKSTVREVEYALEEHSANNTYTTTVTYNVKYVNTKEQEQLASKKIDDILDEIITDDMYTYEKVKAVNDYIVLNGQYDTSLKNYSHYDLLFEGKSVCNGYALLVYNMLKKLNIPVILVVGTADNGQSSQGHIWNMVNIGGYWFNLDATWNDPIPNKPDKVSYEYFLVNDNELYKTHTADTNCEHPKAYKNYDEYLSEFKNNEGLLIAKPTTDSINIKIHDSYVDFNKYDKEPVEPFVEDGRTLVPLRAVFTELGFDVSWDNKTSTATVSNGKDILTIQPNNMYAAVNGKKCELDVPARIVNDRIVVPVRFISEALGSIVLWDNENKVVYIY